MNRIFKNAIVFLLAMGSLRSLAQCDQFNEQLIPSLDNFMECGSFELTYSRIGWSPFIYNDGMMPESIVIETSDNITLSVAPAGGNVGWLWNGAGWSYDADNDHNPANDPGDMNDSCTWHFKFMIQIGPSAYNQECMIHVTPYSDSPDGAEQFGQLIQWQAMPVAAGVRETATKVIPLYTEYYDLRGSKVENCTADMGIIVRRITYSDGSQRSELRKVVAGQQ